MAVCQHGQDSVGIHQLTAGEVQNTNAVFHLGQCIRTDQTAGLVIQRNVYGDIVALCKNIVHGSGFLNAAGELSLIHIFTGISEWDIAGDLQSVLGIPFFAENDVNACAVAERRFGLCKNTPDFLWLTMSNGVGGAVFLNGNLLRGRNLGAG